MCHTRTHNNNNTNYMTNKLVIKFWTKSIEQEILYKIYKLIKIRKFIFVWRNFRMRERNKSFTKNITYFDHFTLFKKENQRKIPFEHLIHSCIHSFIHSCLLFRHQSVLKLKTKYRVFCAIWVMVDTNIIHLLGFI